MATLPISMASCGRSHGTQALPSRPMAVSAYRNSGLGVSLPMQAHHPKPISRVGAKCQIVSARSPSRCASLRRSLRQKRIRSSRPCLPHQGGPSNPTPSRRSRPDRSARRRRPRDLLPLGRTERNPVRGEGFTGFGDQKAALTQRPPMGLLIVSVGHSSTSRSRPCPREDRDDFVRSGGRGRSRRGA